VTAIYSRPNNFIGFEGENVTERKYQDSDFANPKLFCDVIMKGGITSGVIYPLALAELAKRYRFTNIGGTSAGAIAAAAAEYGRNVPGKGFLRLTTLPAEAGAILFTLFQPTATVKPLFNISSPPWGEEHDQPNGSRHCRGDLGIPLVSTGWRPRRSVGRNSGILAWRYGLYAIRFASCRRRLSTCRNPCFQEVANEAPSGQ
jgi:hypothetical protein